MNKKTQSDLFTDLYKLILNEAQEKPPLKATFKKSESNFQTDNFLENERKRLQNLNDLFSFKMDNLKTSKVLDHLILDQEKKIKEERKNILLKIEKNPEIFLKEISSLWDKAFANS